MRKTEQLKENLEVRLKALEREYDLATLGLRKGAVTTIAAMASAILCLIFGMLPVLITGREYLSGTHMVIIFGIIAAAVVIYFSFVFGRAAKIRAEITKTKKLIEVSSGEKVR